MARNPQSEVVHLDTHIVCRLYEGRIDPLSATTAQAMLSGARLVTKDALMRKHCAAALW